MARFFLLVLSPFLVLSFVGLAVSQTQMLKGFGPLFTFMRPPFLPPPPLNQIRRMGSPHAEARSAESLEIDVDRVHSDESVEKRFTLSIKPDSVSISEPDNASDEELVNFPNDTQEDDRPVSVPIEIVKKEEQPTNVTAEKEPILAQFNTLPNESLPIEPTVNVHTLDLISLSPSPSTKTPKPVAKKPVKKRPSEIDDYPVFDISMEDGKPVGLPNPTGPLNHQPIKKKKKTGGYKIKKRPSKDDDDDDSNESGEEDDEESGPADGESESRERFIQYEGIAESMGYGDGPNEGPPPGHSGQDSNENHDGPERRPPPPQRPPHDGPPPSQHSANQPQHPNQPIYFSDYQQNYYGPTPTEKPQSGILHSVASAGQGLMSWASYPFRSIPKISLELGAKIKQEEQQAQQDAAAQQQNHQYDELMKAYAELLQSKSQPGAKGPGAKAKAGSAVSAVSAALTPTGSSPSKTSLGSETKGEVGGVADDPSFKHSHWFKKSEKKKNKKAKKAWKKHHKRPTYHKYSGGWGPGPAPKLPYYNYEAHNALTHNLNSYNNQGKVPYVPSLNNFGLPPGVGPGGYSLNIHHQQYVDKYRHKGPPHHHGPPGPPHGRIPHPPPHPPHTHAHIPTSGHYGGHGGHGGHGAHGVPARGTPGFFQYEKDKLQYEIFKLKARKKLAYLQNKIELKKILSILLQNKIKALEWIL